MLITGYHNKDSHQYYDLRLINPLKLTDLVSFTSSDSCLLRTILLPLLLGAPPGRDVVWDVVFVVGLSGLLDWNIK